MIDISHQQARFLIRRSADTRLPEEQWTALQAHLERCASCRAVFARQRELERNARRVLVSRWRPVDRSQGGLGGEVRRFRQERSERRRTALYAAFGLAAALLIVLFSGARIPQPEIPAPAGVVETQPAASPTPLPEGLFRGVVAYESFAEGSSDIFLLTAGPGGGEQINLTAHPAEDTHPSWSPDGEWLAFLSDRTGKRELYVISVAGTRLTQLTARADIAWEGAPQWSGDGRWIALTGRRLEQAADPWVYLVPLDGSDPVSLPGTRGTPGGARFSPEHPLLAVRNAGGGLTVYSLQQSWRAAALSLEDYSAAAALADFDWTFGDSLIYLAGGPAGSTVAIRGPLGPLSPVPEAGGRDALVRSSGVQFSSMALQPGGQAVAVLPAGGNCRAARLFYAYVYDEAQSAELAGLCLLSELDHASWSAGSVDPAQQGWLVAAARPAGDPAAAPGLYAMRVPGQPDPSSPVIVERLAPLPEAQESAFSTPRVRPQGRSLQIRPAAVILAPPGDTTPFLPRSAHGSLLLVEPGDNDTAALLAADGLGGSRTTLLPAESAVRCPAWSPNGTKVAFLSDRSWREAARAGSSFARRGPDEVFVMDIESREITRLAGSVLTGRAASTISQGFTCPAWSPNGKYLSVVSTVGQGGGLMVLTPEGQVAFYAPSDRPTPFTTPVWTSDGEWVVFAQQASGGVPRIVGVRWRDPSASRTLDLNGWDDVHGLSISPDGESLAFITVRHAETGRPARASLRVISLLDFEDSYFRIFSDYDSLSARAPARLAWTRQGELVYAVPRGPLERDKALLVRVNPTDGSTRVLAVLEDELFSWSLSGAQLVYSTESGLWALPLDEPSAPLLLDSAAPAEVALGGR